MPPKEAIAGILQQLRVRPWQEDIISRVITKSFLHPRPVYRCSFRPGGIAYTVTALTIDGVGPRQAIEK
jgi:hypothetical protein